MYHTQLKLTTAHIFTAWAGSKTKNLDGAGGRGIRQERLSLATFLHSPWSFIVDLPGQPVPVCHGRVVTGAVRTQIHHRMICDHLVVDVWREINLRKDSGRITRINMDNSLPSY